MIKEKGILILIIAVTIFCGAKLITTVFQPPQGVLPAETTRETSEQDISLADQTLASMTLEQKVGQLFFACNYGSSIDPAELKTLMPGGYVLFGEFFADKDRDLVESELAALQEASFIPLLIGVDEEGGTVNRVSKYPAFREAPFSSPRNLLKAGGSDLLAADLREKSKLLLSLGINVNLAPVCDLSNDPDNFIYPRTFGKNAQETASLITLYVKTSASLGIGCVLKHFPGYGKNVDTHTGIARDSRSLETFRANDFLPFRAGIDAGADCILLNHNIIEAVDPEHPATLSAAVHTLLQKELGFKGVIMTDDLSMDAIAEYGNGEDPAVSAIKAGNDLICTGDYPTRISAVLKALRSGDLTERQINISVRKVLQWKEKLGLLKEEPQEK